MASLVNTLLFVILNNFFEEPISGENFSLNVSTLPGESSNTLFLQSLSQRKSAAELMFKKKRT